MRAKINKRAVETASPKGKDWVLFDTELIGFGCKITPHGRRVYFAQSRVAGRRVRVTIGTHGQVTAEQARVEAHKLLAQMATGEDPSIERAEAKRAPLLKDLAERYLSHHAATMKKESSQDRDRRLIERFILPALGGKKVDAITRADVARLHYDVGKGTPIQANRVLACLSKMMSLAVLWGWRSDAKGNPCKGIQRFKENSRERFLSPDELSRLGQAISELGAEGAELPSVLTAVKLLVLTGCRREEVLRLRWQDVDFERACLHLPDSKTGAKVVPLGAPALEVLAQTPRLVGNPYVCPGLKPDGHLVGLPRAWARICKRADLEGLRIHDLRHSFASVGAASGMGLPVIGKLLGHTQAATTQRYAHLHQDPLRAAADEIAGRIAEALKRPVEQKVVHLRPIG